MGNSRLVLALSAAFAASCIGLLNTTVISVSPGSTSFVPATGVDLITTGGVASNDPARMAELIEMPLMFVVILLGARFVVRKFALPTRTPVRLGAGLLALGLSLAAEVLLAAVLQDRSVVDYIASRDPVSGSVYLAMLVLFALMPLILARVEAARKAAGREPG